MASRLVRFVRYLLSMLYSFVVGKRYRTVRVSQLARIKQKEGLFDVLITSPK